MNAGQTPKTDVSTILTRRYAYDPVSDALKLTPQYCGEDIFVTRVTVVRRDDQTPTATVEGVVVKRDGSPGKSARNGGTYYYSQRGAPGWIVALMEQMPTARVTLTPPSKP